MLIVLLIVLGLVGVAAAQQPRSGGTLRVAWEADISGLDPHVVHERVSHAETALHNAVLLVVTLSLFHDTMRSHNRVKPEQSVSAVRTARAALVVRKN